MGYMQAPEASCPAYEAEDRVSSNLPPCKMLVR